MLFFLCASKNVGPIESHAISSCSLERRRPTTGGLFCFFKIRHIRYTIILYFFPLFIVFFLDAMPRSSYVIIE